MPWLKLIHVSRKEPCVAIIIVSWRFLVCGDVMWRTTCHAIENVTVESAGSTNGMGVSMHRVHKITTRQHNENVFMGISLLQFRNRCHHTPFKINQTYFFYGNCTIFHTKWRRLCIPRLLMAAIFSFLAKRLGRGRRSLCGPGHVTSDIGMCFTKFSTALALNKIISYIFIISISSEYADIKPYFTSHIWLTVSA